MRPIRRHADLRVIKVRPRHRIQRPRQPVADENHRQRRPLHSCAAQTKQEQQRIAQADLRQRVFEGPVRLRLAHRAQEDAQQDQQQRPPQRVTEQRGARLSARQATGDGEGQRHADEERERRLNQVMQRATHPGDVVGVEFQELPEAALGISRRDAPDVQHFRHHQEHDEASIRVERGQPCGRGRSGRGIHACGECCAVFGERPCRISRAILPGIPVDAPPVFA